MFIEIIQSVLALKRACYFAGIEPPTAITFPEEVYKKLHRIPKYDGTYRGEDEPLFIYGVKICFSEKNQ